MKKLLIGATAVFAVFAGAIIFLLSFDFNRAGKENVYVQIVKDGEVEETKLDSGEVMERFWYNLTAYRADGESISVEFSAAKNLRQDAYLMLYLNKDNEVTSYDEVQLDNIPQAAKDKL